MATTPTSCTATPRHVTQHTLASTEYGAAVSAVVRHENFCGTQFHPERSAATGARVLANFLRL